MMDLLDEVAQHRFGDFKISDDAILHGPNGHDISRRASEHPFGFVANGQDVCGARLNRDHGGFAKHNSSVSYVHEGIGCTQVYPNVIGKEAFYLCEHEFSLTRREIKSGTGKVKIINRMQGKRFYTPGFCVDEGEMYLRLTPTLSPGEGAAWWRSPVQMKFTGRFASGGGHLHGKRLLTVKIPGRVGSTRICCFVPKRLNLGCEPIITAPVSSDGARRFDVIIAGAGGCQDGATRADDFGCGRQHRGAQSVVD